MGIVPMGGVGRRFTCYWNRREREILNAGYPKVIAIQRYRMTINSPIPMGENFEKWKSRAEVLVNHVSTVHFVGAAFAKHQQTSGVIDLTVHENNGLYGCIAGSSCGL